MNIAYIDDEASNLNLYSMMLQDRFKVNLFQNPLVFDKTLTESDYSAIIIDVFMPMMDGVELYHVIKSHPGYNGCPLFFISSDDSEHHKIRSLGIGVDDFFGRGMKKQEIILRLENRIRTFKGHKKILQLGQIKLDTDVLRVLYKGETSDVTLIEFKILKKLLMNYPESVGREELTSYVWGDRKVLPASLNTHISNLRLKFSQWDYEIISLKGIGYQLIPCRG